MAAVTQELASGEAYDVTVTYDDQTGAITRIDWTVTSGTLVMTIHRTGRKDIVSTATTNGGVNLPNGYAMTLSSKGDWYWASASISYETSWHP